MNGKIASGEAEIANLRQNQPAEELIKEIQELEVQIRHSERELQGLMRKQKSPNSPINRNLEAKRRQLEQEYQRRKAEESSYKNQQLFQEYEKKFKEIAAPLANLIPNVSQQLASLGYKRLKVNWKQKDFGRIHLTTLEPSVIFEIVKN